VIVVSHPIQYYAPYYRALAASSGLDVHVIFAARIGLDKLRDREMGIDISWDTDLLGGYSNEFLPEAARITQTGFREINNPSVWKALHRAQPDVVLLHGYSNLTTLRALAWCRTRGVPIMMISDSSLHFGTVPAVRALKTVALPIVLAQYTAFLSIGDANQAYLEAFGAPRARIFRVPNMVDERFWTARAQRAEIREQKRAALGLADDDFVMLFVGKFIPRKRPLDIIAALARLRAMNVRRRPCVLFAGSGELADELRAQAATAGVDARFLGFVNINELPELYCAVDALVHPAEIETFGVIVLEAAILGLPLILSDRVGAIGSTSVARLGENAIVHASSDVGGLANAIKSLADDQALCRKMSAASLAISDELNWRKSVSGTVDAVALCLGHEATPSEVRLT
jgi:glycosyltransferase involved in cell wall biosynthesis